MGDIEDILKIGKKVDTYIHNFLLKGAANDFKPILRYQIDIGGKRIRAILTLLCCEATGGTLEEGLSNAAIAEMIHNYSLLLDDVIDRGEVRRGKRTVRIQYTDAMALLAAMHYREVIGDLVLESNDLETVEALIIKTIKDLIEGERLDILFEQAGRNGEYIKTARRQKVTFNDYLHMIGKKTASLIRASCELGCITSKASPQYENALSNFGWNMGIAFQIIDDYLDIFGEKTGKEKGKDIKEHKLGNAVILLAFDDLHEDDKRDILHILSKDVVDDSMLRRAYQIIDKTNAKTRTMDMGRMYLEKGLKSLESLPDSSAKSMLKDLSYFIISRLY